MDVSAVSFGELLRSYRIATGFSQEFLAERARLSVESIGALERGARRAPYRHTVALLAAALELDAEQRSRLENAARGTRIRASRSPQRVTAFVGREPDIARITKLLNENRLVTITGPGGVGKTRTALEVVSRLSRIPQADIRVVELGALGEGTFVSSALATSLGATRTDRGNVVDAIVSALGSRRILIFLDNCEHLISDVAVHVSLILRACRGVTFLATTRERLAIRGEALYRLSSLDVPIEQQATIASARRYEAVELFLRRVEVADPAVAFEDRDAESVAELCRRLDGLPLAIELAAARIPALGLAEVRERLHRGFALDGDTRDLPARQQTMLATIEWSYKLLDLRERRLLDRIAIFSGTFTLEAAEAICSGDGIETSAVGDVLSSLVDKSLVNVALSESIALYTPLLCVRAFSRGRIVGSDEWANLVRLHRAWVDASGASTPRIPKSDVRATGI